MQILPVIVLLLSSVSFIILLLLPTFFSVNALIWQLCIVHNICIRIRIQKYRYRHTQAYKKNAAQMIKNLARRKNSEHLTAYIHVNTLYLD